MKTQRCLILPLVLLAARAVAETPVAGWRLIETAKVAGDGAAVSKPGFATNGWMAAVVPGTVLTSMVAAGRYPEPLYGVNNLSVPETLCRQSYWYRTEFEVPKANAERHTWLRFDGVNYMAEVWVNGHDVGRVRGAFGRGLFDVTPWVKPGERAAVAVEMLPPNHPGVPLEQSLAAGTGRNGGDTGADGVTIAATVGWDWIPGIRDRDMGLWQGVATFSTGDVTIHDPFVKTTLPLPRVDSATLDVSTTLRNESTMAQTGSLEGRIEGTRLTFRVPVSLAAGETKEVAVPSMTLDRPRLWWPNGYGKQDLYRLRLRFVEKGTSDEAQAAFGVRQMAFFRGGSDKMTVQVNGVPIVCRGGNWGIDEAMKRSPDARMDAQVRLHRDANCTMVRNWVGQSTQENFYAACDKYGILVWDDFWLANPSDGPVPVDDGLFLDNAKEKILRYRNHPSIALWCGRNEGNPPPVIEAGLERMTKELDGTRFYQPHSAATNGVSGGGPYGQTPFARYFTLGDAMHTEVGAPSIPTVESIEGMMPKADWWPINDDWAYHDLLKGAQQGDRYPFVLSRRYGTVAGFKDFARKGAMMTYETYRAMFEGRNSRLFAPASGTLLWMSNPAQPSFVWQLYHHDLDPTAAMYGTKVAGERVHVQTAPDGTTQVVNTTTDALKGLRLVRTLYGKDGEKTGETTRTVDATPLAATAVVGTDAPAPLVRLRLYDGKALLSDNVYWGTGEGRDDVSYLDRLPKVTLSGSARGTKGGVRVTLRNPSTTPAILTHLTLRKADGSRVLPAFASDNFLTIWPGESRTVTIEGAGTQVFVDGWNVAGVTGGGLRYDEEARPEPPLPPIPPRVPIPGTVVSIDAGGADDPASPWSPDEAFVSGGAELAQPGMVTGSDLPQKVLQTERYGEMVYTIPVPDGPCRVRIVFAEGSQRRVGGRRFAVQIGRQRVLEEFDIFAEAGGADKAVVKEFAAEPDRNGNLMISFRKGSANEPEVRAIQILKP